MKKTLTTIIILYLSINSSFLFAQITLTVEGTVVNNSEAVTWEGVNIQRNVPASFTYRNNSITSVNTSGYMLQAGDESVAACNNNLNGEIITGNKFVWNGTDMTSITHGVFTGNNINAIIKYNYLYQVPMGIIRKSASNMTNVSGSVAYNIINRGMIGVVVKGMSGVNIYNNTFYSDRNFANTASGRGIIDIYTNGDVSPNSVSHGTKIKNNIFYTKYQVNNIRILDNESLTDFECDYNVYWCEAGTPNFYVNGSVITFAQWQALGYDTHSVVVNPNFNNFTDFVPLARLDYGTDLGTTWNTGLSTSAVWTVNSTPATTVQNGSWQIGARVYAAASSSNTYYVSPGGSDSNPGTISQPFFTLNKAWTVVSAGDIVYMRGGTYVYPTSASLTNKSGSAGNLIKIWAYPGEKPVIDYDSFTPTTQIIGISLNNTNYLHIKGIRVANIHQPTSGSIAQYGLILWNNVSNCIFEQMEIDHIGGWGVVIGENSNNNLFLNCDSHHNADPYSTNGEPYGWSDGFQSGSASSTGNTLIGCRAWWNSDDGFDLRESNGNWTIKNCWSFWNGYIPGTFTQAGNGEGYKLGGKKTPASNNILRTVENCLAFENRTTGFSPDPDDPTRNLGVEMYNCTSYKNKLVGINFQYSNVGIVRNNIVYNNTTNYYSWGTNVTHNHNNLDIPITVSDADFVSVSSVGTDGPRQADGSLPNISFLKLATGSKLIDAGEDVGIPYGGNAPDLGAFETQTGATNPIPVFTSAIVENTTPSLLGMTYDLNLNNLIVPAPSTFSVRVNSVVRTVNTVAISGTKVQLTLANPILYGDVVTLTYTKPTSNPLQTTSGGTAASISNQTVINNRVNVAPTAAITSPITNSSFTALTNITITANASDADGSVNTVEFYNGSTKLGSKSAAPYSFTWNNVAAGTYSLTVIAIDNLNVKTTSSAISISVNNETTSVNQPPVVKISNPLKGNKYEKLATINIDAVASDPDGTISKVEFYCGSNKLVELTSAPYSYTWKDVGPGTYSITAVATDNLNATTTSSSIEFIVAANVKYDANSEIINLYPNPNDGHFSIKFINPLLNEKSTIIITDLAGKEVYNGPVSKEETLKQFDLSDSKSGIYVMLIKDKEILVTKKFIKN